MVAPHSLACGSNVGYLLFIYLFLSLLGVRGAGLEPTQDPFEIRNVFFLKKKMKRKREKKHVNVAPG